MTQSTSVLGSPIYMSPEQLSSARDIDARSDIWSLGVVIFELLTGQQPFVAETLPQLCLAIVNNPAPLVSDVRPDVPAALAGIIDRCLHKDRSSRYQDIGALARELAKFAPRHARLSALRATRVAHGGAKTLDASLDAGPEFGSAASESPSEPVPEVVGAPSGGAPAARTLPSAPELAIARPRTRMPAWGLAAAITAVGAGALFAVIAVRGESGAPASQENAPTNSTSTVASPARSTSIPAALPSEVLLEASPAVLAPVPVATSVSSAHSLTAPATPAVSRATTRASAASLKPVLAIPDDRN
jgi:serine/threonine-protein kinase